MGGKAPKIEVSRCLMTDPNERILSCRGPKGKQVKVQVDGKGQIIAATVPDPQPSGSSDSSSQRYYAPGRNLPGGQVYSVWFASGSNPPPAREARIFFKNPKELLAAEKGHQKTFVGLLAYLDSIQTHISNNGNLANYQLEINPDLQSAGLLGLNQTGAMNGYINLLQNGERVMQITTEPERVTVFLEQGPLVFYGEQAKRIQELMLSFQDLYMRGLVDGRGENLRPPHKTGSQLRLSGTRSDTLAAKACEGKEYQLRVLPYQKSFIQVYSEVSTEDGRKSYMLVYDSGEATTSATVESANFSLFSRETNRFVVVTIPESEGRAGFGAMQNAGKECFEPKGGLNRRLFGPKAVLQFVRSEIDQDPSCRTSLTEADRAQILQKLNAQARCR